MKKLYLCFFLVIFLIKIECKDNEKPKILSISSGTSFGFCMGYCRRSINITSNPYELIALKEPNGVQESYPPVKKQYPFSWKQWYQLICLVNLNTFQSLDDRIGCPDCADGGAEWIEINWLNGTKLVTFEYGKLIEGFEGFINKLRQLRKQYVENL